MKIKDFSKEGNSKFEPKNPKIIQNSKTKYYTIEYDAVYEDGHIEKHTGFGSNSQGVIKEYLKTYFEINDNLILRLMRADNMFCFYDYGVSQNCNNPDSFGEVCVKCGNCGRIFDECGKCSNISEFPAEVYEEEQEMSNEETRNISKYAHCDDFICEKCGVRLGDWVKSVYDEDAEDTYQYEYEFKFCPECGRRVVEE